MNKIITIILLSIAVFSSCINKEAQEGTNLNIMSFNIRYDNPEDGENNWQYRKDIAAEIVKSYDIDLLGTQEVLVNQLKDLEDRLTEYVSLGVGREDGVHKGEHSSIFYKKSRFEQLDYGNFWLSETPDTVSVGWDAALERIATWVKLKDKESGVQFLFMNVHLDHVGQEARANSIKLLLDNISKYGKDLPVILTGDFNARPTSDVIQRVVGLDVENHLIDSKKAAKVVEGEESTFHAFRDEPKYSDQRIDYIFINDKIIVDKYETIDKRLNGVFLSDHTPIFAKIIIK